MPTSNPPCAAAVVVAAGRSLRFGAPDKVFAPLAGRPVVAYALDAIERARLIRDVILVAGEQTHATAGELIAGGSWPKVRAIVIGGVRRQDSVAAGMAAVPEDIDVVVIHDSARPLAPSSLFDRCVERASEVGAAIAAVPLADTLKRVEGERITATVPRDQLWAAQTPQAFWRSLLLEALARLGDADVTDDAAMVERLGHPVTIVPGTTSNLKITLPDDLAVAEALLTLRPGTT
jgi:2-C-methyl-D-erythritol 4-phosphate cytidylyltransferase